MVRAARYLPNLRLRQARERRCWSQGDVADAIGTTRLNVGRWEQGRTFPGPYYRQRLCAHFGLDAKELGLLPSAAAVAEKRPCAADKPAGGEPAGGEPFPLRARTLEPLDDLPVSLRIAIKLCVARLDAPAAAALRALAVFPPSPNTFSVAAALAISAMSAETLDRLCGERLLDRSGPTRYSMPRNIAGYLRLEPIDPAAGARLVAYGGAFAEAHVNEREALALEIDNILAALDLAHARRLDTAVVRMANAMAPYLLAYGHHALAETHLERARLAAERLRDATGLARVEFALCQLCAEREDAVSARAR